MNIQINRIIMSSRVDGPGERAVLFVQGCPIHCPGCQSRQTWDPDGGIFAPVAMLVEHLARHAKTRSVTVSGGEPFAQPAALAELVTTLRKSGFDHILVYTGYIWEQLFDPTHPAYPYLKVILEQVDVLVDGPFMRELDDDLITWRGSRNQRPIDVAESLAAGAVVALDWDFPRITIDRDGNLVLPVGLAPDFPLGSVENSRMCGQLTEIVRAQPC